VARSSALFVVAVAGWDGGIYAHMRRVLDGELGGGLYRKRKAMIEPVFANTKFSRRIDRFGRRGRSAVRSGWRPRAHLSDSHRPER
jgi:hypothetical protein